LELRRYAALLRRNWWIVAVAALVAMAGAYGISKATKPIFRATVKLAASASVAGSGNASNYIALTTGGLLNQYASDLSTRMRAQQVSEALKLDLPPEKVQGEIKAVPSNQDLTIRVDVEDTDPNRARDIANKLANLYVQEKQASATKAAAVLGGQQDVVLVSIQDPAVTPQRPIKPNTRVNVAAAGILGVILGVLIVFGLDWWDDTIRGAADAETVLDTRILAAIPRLPKGRTKGSVYSADERALSLNRS
jgi:capsular polysaccharide biosynthesis protein